MIYRYFLRPIFFLFDPETVHTFVLKILAWVDTTFLVSFLEKFFSVTSKKLTQNVFGITFPNPVGLAAGFDKNAEAPMIFKSLGFGSVEIGTVTDQSQIGNERPRMFRLPVSQALINRMGFNNGGAVTVRDRLREIHPSKRGNFPIGVSIGANKDVAKKSLNLRIRNQSAALQKFRKGRYSNDVASYFVVNVSSPNTEGLRDQQHKDQLRQLLLHIKKIEKNIPILVKIAPDLTLEQIDDILEVCIEVKIDGIIAVNTTIDRSRVKGAKNADQYGGLSGRPLTGKSDAIVAYIYSKLKGSIPIIGVGGIFNGKDALRMIQAGANLIQAYTGFVYEGPSFAKNINAYLLDYMKQNGIQNISQLVGQRYEDFLPQWT